MTELPDKTTDEESIHIDSNLPIGGLVAIMQPDTGKITVVVAQRQFTPEQARKLSRDLLSVLERVNSWETVLAPRFSLPQYTTGVPR